MPPASSTGMTALEPAQGWPRASNLCAGILRSEGGLRREYETPQEITIRPSTSESTRDDYRSGMHLKRVSRIAAKAEAPNHDRGHARVAPSTSLPAGGRRPIAMFETRRTSPRVARNGRADAGNGRSAPTGHTLLRQG
jgi:hypothetical protein